MAVISALVFVAGFAWAASDMKAQITRDIETLQADMKTVKERARIIADQVVATTPEQFRRAGMLEWCQAAEHVNKDFRCPDPYALPSYKAAVHKWEQEERLLRNP